MNQENKVTEDTPTGGVIMSSESCTIGVGDGTGSLFVHGSYEAVKRVQEIIFENEHLRTSKAEPIPEGLHSGSTSPGGFVEATMMCSYTEAVQVLKNREQTTTTVAPERASGPSITLDLKQATELLEMFGGEPGLVTLQLGNEQSHSGSGLYAYYNDIPEEGAAFLGSEPDDEAAPALAPQEGELTDTQLTSACISYRHDFGLLPKDERDRLMFQAREWDRAFLKERNHETRQVNGNTISATQPGDLPWIWLRRAIKGVPVRVEPIGGQRTSYVRLDEVLEWIDEGERRANLASGTKLPKTLADVPTNGMKVTNPVVARAHADGLINEMILAAARVQSPALLRHGLDPLTRDGVNTIDRMKRETEQVRKTLQTALDTVPKAAQPVPRYKIGYRTDEWGVVDTMPGGIPDPAGDWVLYDDHAAALASAAQPADPVTVEAVAKVVRHDEGIGLDWLIEGGISALAVGEVLVCANAAVTDDTGSGEVYLAPAAAAKLYREADFPAMCEAIAPPYWPPAR